MNKYKTRNYRAKTLNGDWKYGNLSIKDNEYFISNEAGMPFAFKVRPETVGQFIGIICKEDRKEIYEGDIVSHYMYSKLLKVIFLKEVAQYRLESFDGGLGNYPDFHLKVVGNVYDNPGLFEGQSY